MAAKSKKKRRRKRNLGAVGPARDLGYAAVESSNNRKDQVINLVSADRDLPHRDRDKAISRTRQHTNDFSVAAWGMRKHLDFVAEHTFSCKSKDRGLKREIEAMITEKSKAKNFDIRGVHGVERFARIFEGMALIDGDVFSARLRSGHLQAIEGDRVRSDRQNKGKWENGLRTDRNGRTSEISVHRRKGKRFVHERNIRYERVFHHGYFQRFDQGRGISPALSGTNDMQDVYESKEYALVRSKLAQLFGIVIKRESTESGTEQPDFKKGAVVLELPATDTADFMENKTPATEFQTFMDKVIAMGLKAIDIPYSFYQEDFTNFFGQKSALILYLKSSVSKRRNLRQNFFEPWTDWQLNLLELSGELRLPRGVDKVPYRWIAAGTPWANPLQEVQASIQEIAMGLSSRQRKVMEITGEDVFDIVDELAEEEAYFKLKGVPLANPSQLLLREVSNVEE